MDVNPPSFVRHFGELNLCNLTVVSRKKELVVWFHFLDISSTFVAPLILSFLILSSLVTPLIHLNILISATSNLFSCAFFTSHVPAPYAIAGLSTVLYTFPLILKLILQSHRIPDTLFQVFFILIVFYASSPHPSLHYLPMSLLDI